MTAGAAVAAGAAAIAPDATGAAATGAAENGDEVLVGDVVDEGPAVGTAPVSAEDAVLDEPVDVAGMTAGYEPPAVTSDSSSSESPDVRAAADEAATADVHPQGA